MNELATQFDKLPPHDLDAEVSVLASFAIDKTGDIRRQIIHTIRPESFYLQDNAIIADALWRMHESQQPIDIVTLRAELAKSGKLEEIGGTPYLAEMLERMPSAAAGAHYAEIVRDHAARRWLIAKSFTLRNAAYDTANEPVKIAAALRESLDPFISRIAPKEDRSGGAEELRQRLADLTEGRIVNVPFPGFPRLSKIGQALLPGSMAILIGAPGDGKTFAVLSWVAAWTAQGIPVSVLMGEQKRSWHLTRFVAMLCQDGNMLNDEWMRANPDIVAEREEMCRDAAEAVGTTIHETKLGGMSLSDAADWVESQAEKSRIVIVDPITALDPGAKSWETAFMFASRTKRAMEKHGSSAILVTHPKAGQRPNGMITLDDIAGGQAYQRFSDFVMSIYKHEPRKDVEIKKMGFPEQISVNRTLYLNKARNGVGGGCRIAADFTRELQWQELGVVTKELKKREKLELP